MAFETVKYFPIMVPDLAPVAQEVMDHYRKQDYEATGGPTGPGKWHVSLRKGDTFKAIIGMKTALNIDIESTNSGTMVKAGIGVFGLDSIPQILAIYVFWPVILAQIWGVVHQAKLDDEVIARIESSLVSHGRATGGGSPAAGTTSAGSSTIFCPNCGAKLQPPARFCSSCGARLAGQS